MWTAEKIYYQNSSAYTRAYQGDELVWDKNVFRFTAKEDNSFFDVFRLSSGQTLEYSTDFINWTNWTTNTHYISLQSGETVYLRGILSSNNSVNDYTQFELGGNLKVAGNINYLWNYNNLSAPLKEYCGYNLFVPISNIYTALTDASELELPATTLADHCYYRMFFNCSGLTSAPALPATTLSEACYRDMFYNCKSLTTAPALPATTLALECYMNMFYDCYNLTNVPSILPATALTDWCYDSMFYNCTSMTTAPVLPATTLANFCYRDMFGGCRSLNYIKCLATNISASNCTTNWVNGVSSTGTFVSDPTMTGWTIGNNGIPTGWISNIPLIFTAKASDSTIGLNRLSSNQTIEFSYDGNNWFNMTTGTSITLSYNYIYVRGVLSSNNTDSDYTQFKMDGNFKASGNINYLWNKDNPDAALKNGCGIALFSGCTALTDVVDLALPSTTLSERCYRNMFRNTRITTAPVLPATSLATYCYSSMFNGCTSLTSAPALPATTLATYCYYYMFEGCTSLTQAPELPAPTLVNYCYNNMFKNCSSLNYIKCLATNRSATNCTVNWVSGVSSSGTFTKASSMTSWPTGNNGIPTNWTVHNA